MLNLLKEELNTTFTENGAVTCRTTGSYCLDLFSTIGAMRQEDRNKIAERFIRAYAEDKDTAVRLLFFARDVRGGLGERKVFRILLKWLAINEPLSVIKNLEYVSEFGRFDDLLVLIDTPCEKDMIRVIKKQLDEDIKAMASGENISLLAKWLPSVNASNKDTVRNAKRIAKTLGMTCEEYRKVLTKLRAKISIIENNLRKKDYSFDYSKQPSRAMYKYRQAFVRNDKERYVQYITKVSKGEAVLHADNVTPYELVEPFFMSMDIDNLTPDEKAFFNATWQSLPDYGNDENTLAVIDTSASMYWGNAPIPGSVSLSLGLYFAEHNKGIFKNHFIEFSSRPQLIEVKGDTFIDRLRYVLTFSEVADTNLEAVFDLILNTAVKHKVSQEELPSKLVVISDMEFNCCVKNASLSNFENAKKKYEEKGYKLPEVVFWNVNSRNTHQPVTMNEQGVALVSGLTPKLFDMIAGGNLSPYKFMMDILGRERYKKIVA